MLAAAAIVRGRTSHDACRCCHCKLIPKNQKQKFVPDGPSSGLGALMLSITDSFVANAFFAEDPVGSPEFDKHVPHVRQRSELRHYVEPSVAHC